MCIRDRASADQDSPVVCFGESNGAATVTVSGGNAPYTYVSVSYTHLRAHETVLDLVCRLLLEKKNHTKIHLH